MILLQSTRFPTLKQKKPCCSIQMHKRHMYVQNVHNHVILLPTLVESLWILLTLPGNEHKDSQWLLLLSIVMSNSLHDLILVHANDS